MSKTFMYLIVTIVAYLLIVKGLGVIETTDETDKTDSKKNETKNNVSKGAAGQQRYRFGAPYSNKVQEESASKAADDLSNKIKNDLSYTR